MSIDARAEVRRQLLRRRSALVDEWGLSDEVVLIGAGDPIPVPGRGDLTYPFHAHSEYYCLTDRNRPGGCWPLIPRKAGWILRRRQPPWIDCGLERLAMSRAGRRPTSLRDGSPPVRLALPRGWELRRRAPDLMAA